MRQQSQQDVTAGQLKFTHTTTYRLGVKVCFSWPFSEPRGLHVQQTRPSGSVCLVDQPLTEPLTAVCCSLTYRGLDSEPVCSSKILQWLCVFTLTFEWVLDLDENSYVLLEKNTTVETKQFFLQVPGNAVYTILNTNIYTQKRFCMPVRWWMEELYGIQKNQIQTFYIRFLYGSSQ